MKRFLLILIILLLSACNTEIPNKDDIKGEKILHKIIIDDDVLNGVVTASKSEAYKDERIYIYIEPNKGYELDLIYLDDEIIERPVFFMPDKDVLVSATFKRNIIEEECKHNYIETIIKNPSCDSKGEIQCKCEYCDDTYIKETSKLDHNYIERTITEATCKNDGKIEFKCEYCDDTYFEEINKLNHEYNEVGVCKNCGDKQSKSYLNTLFGDDIDIYTNNEENPYNIDLNKYGSDVVAYFYEPKLSTTPDPYTNVNKTEFYADYAPATSYEDAYYRTQHKLMSGDISDQYYLPTEGKKVEDGKAIRATTATYVLDTDGDYLAYIPNTAEGEEYIIFYGAAYTSLNEVAAYLLAFGDVPANQITNKNSTGQSQAISNWGKYGRVNNGVFSGNPSKYPFQPLLPNIFDIEYREMDFGTTGGYVNSNSNGTYYSQKLYNNGSKIDRGAARFVYVSDSNIKNIDERYVFYTYNHYNDFQEYLNYHNGWGYRFGNQSAGNEYCGGSKDFYALNCVSPTPYITTILKKYNEL